MMQKGEFQLNMKSTLKKNEFPILDYDYNKESFIHQVAIRGILKFQKDA